MSAWWFSLPIFVGSQKRKMSDLGPQWSKDELLRFYEAYHRHGKNWKKVSASVGGKSADRVEALYSAHKTFLSLPEREGTAMGFVALVTGHHNVSDESKRHKEGDQTVRASRKTWTCGEATGKKERELPNAHRSYHERTYGLSSFKKRYYRDEMLTLDVLETLVTVPSEISEPKINIPSGILGKNDSALSLKRVEGTSSVKRSKQGKQVGECISKKRNKRRKKSIAEVVPAEEPNISNHLNLPEERQADATECALNFDPERGLVDLPESTANICSEVPDLTSQTKPEINMFRRSKRKSKRQCGSKYAISNRSDNLQARRLQHCLSSESLRRWCTYEWFYSAFDYPWFMDNDLVNYLNFANLSHLSRLTRSEWSTIKSSLGKPRRFSDHFLVVEKEKLEVYRKKVIVCHPMTRELSDGEVVMMEYDGYRVQFDRPDVGVDKVKDTECMPVNWLDNLPNDLKRKSFLLNNSHNREVEQIPDLTSNEIWDHISGEPVPSKTMHRTSDEQVEIALDTKRLSNKSTSGNCGPLQPLQRPGACMHNAAPKLFTEHPDHIYDCICVIKNQILALVPTASSNAWLPMYI
uniref:SANT domain-containing protein n=1 Tax=Leersia perrieri TaxID=77586 RepID=A0A0D9X542_9ORYZ